jgi:hypothetical protein
VISVSQPEMVIAMACHCYLIAALGIWQGGCLILLRLDWTLRAVVHLLGFDLPHDLLSCLDYFFLRKNQEGSRFVYLF